MIYADSHAAYESTSDFTSTIRDGHVILCGSKDHEEIHPVMHTEDTNYPFIPHEPRKSNIWKEMLRNAEIECVLYRTQLQN